MIQFIVHIHRHSLRIGTGSEVGLCVDAAKKMDKKAMVVWFLLNHSLTASGLLKDLNRDHKHLETFELSWQKVQSFSREISIDLQSFCSRSRLACKKC